MGQFCTGLHVHFFQNPRAIGADGFNTQVQFHTNLRDGTPGGNPAKNLEFAVGKDFVRCLMSLIIETLHQFFSLGLADIFATGMNFSDGFDRGEKKEYR